MNYDDSFETNIYKHLTDRKTGTIIIATKNNKSCQVTVENGEIIAVSMGRFKGYDAAPLLADGGIKRASFNRNMKFPHTKEAFITSTDKFLNKLNSGSDISAVIELESNDKNSVAA